MVVNHIIEEIQAARNQTKYQISETEEHHSLQDFGEMVTPFLSTGRKSFQVVCHDNKEPDGGDVDEYHPNE